MRKKFQRPSKEEIAARQKAIDAAWTQGHRTISAIVKAVGNAAFTEVQFQNKCHYVLKYLTETNRIKEVIRLRKPLGPRLQRKKPEAPRQEPTQTSSEKTPNPPLFQLKTALHTIGELLPLKNLRAHEQLTQRLCEQTLAMIAMIREHHAVCDPERHLMDSLNDVINALTTAPLPWSDFVRINTMLETAEAQITELERASTYRLEVPAGENNNSKLITPPRLIHGVEELLQRKKVWFDDDRAHYLNRAWLLFFRDRRPIDHIVKALEKEMESSTRNLSLRT